MSEPEKTGLGELAEDQPQVFPVDVVIHKGPSIATMVCFNCEYKGEMELVIEHDELYTKGIKVYQGKIIGEVEGSVLAVCPKCEATVASQDFVADLQDHPLKWSDWKMES